LRECGFKPINLDQDKAPELKEILRRVKTTSNYKKYSTDSQRYEHERKPIQNIDL
jgi:hypothetical protein